MTLSPLRSPPRRKDAALWAVAAAMMLGGVALGGLLRPATSEADAVVHAASPNSASSPIPARRPVADPQASAPLEARSATFLARENGFRAVERLLDRAFGPAPSPAPAGAPRLRAVRLARVQRGASSQACLAQAVYYEARGEPVEGQAAVAQVVLNRSRSGRHPADVCGVVFEGASHAGCQFSFACDGRLGGRRPDPVAWRRAETVASEALTGPGRPELAGALNYHADYVRPRWAAQLARTAAIGRHIFYAAARPAARALGWSFTDPAPPASGA